MNFSHGNHFANKLLKLFMNSHIIVRLGAVCGPNCRAGEWVLNPGSDAKVAELVDALDLGSSGATRGSSSLPFRTTGTYDFNLSTGCF